jgi:hypothetical protein
MKTRRLAARHTMLQAFEASLSSLTQVSANDIINLVPIGGRLGRGPPAPPGFSSHHQSLGH